MTSKRSGVRPVYRGTTLTPLPIAVPAERGLARSGALKTARQSQAALGQAAASTCLEPAGS